MTPWIRILLRYGAGVLAARALLPQELADAIGNDPELAAAVAALVAVGVEGAYVIGKKLGWRT